MPENRSKQRDTALPEIEPRIGVLPDANSRTRLLQALDVLLEHRHPGDVSLREVARQAGVSHGLPGYCFGDRRGMLTAYATEGYRILATMQQEALEKVAYEPFSDQLAELGIAYVNFSQDFHRRFVMMFQSHEVDLDNPEYKENSQRAFQPLRECVRGYFAGKPDAESRAPAVMFSAWSLVHGTACLNQGPRLKEYFPAEAIPGLVRQMCYNFARSNLP